MSTKSRKPRPPEDGYVPITLESWRQSAEHIQWALEQMADPKFRDMLSLIRNISVPSPVPLDSIGTAYALGKMKGIEIVLSTLLLISRAPAKEVEFKEPDYSTDITEQE